MPYSFQPSQFADLPALIARIMEGVQQKQQFNTSLATSQANRAEDNARRDRELAGQIQREQQAKLFQGLLANKDTMGSQEYADRYKELTGVDLGPQAPNRVNIIRNPQGTPTGLPSFVSTPMGGMQLPAAKPWSELQLAANNLPSDLMLRAKNAGLRAQERIGNVQASASDEQLGPAAGVLSSGTVEKNKRAEVADIPERDVPGLVWEQFQKNETLQGPARMSVEAMAAAAFAKFQAARRADGSMTPQQVEAQRPLFNEAAAKAETARKNMLLAEQEVAARFAAVRQQQEKSLFPLLTALNAQANSLRQMIPDIAWIAPDAAPGSADYIAKYNKVQGAIEAMMPRVAAEMGADAGTVKALLEAQSGGSGTTTVPDMDPESYKQFSSKLSGKSPEEQSALLQRGLGKVLSQNDYNKLSKDFKLATPMRTDVAKPAPAKVESSTSDTSRLTADPTKLAAQSERERARVRQLAAQNRGKDTATVLRNLKNETASTRKAVMDELFPRK